MKGDVPETLQKAAAEKDVLDEDVGVRQVVLTNQKRQRGAL